jgi:hypothetical protein
VKKWLWVVVAVALLAPGLAAARDMRPGFGAGMQGQQGASQVKKAPDQPPRGEGHKGGEHFKGNKGRLTEEERRQLHRDLERANREIYRR